jgi:hypothetical protein
MVSLARDNGGEVDGNISFALAVADLLELPDDIAFEAAVEAAAKTSTRLDDRASLAHTRLVAIAAGRAALAEARKQ